ncbi:alpha/beta fold hydrolase [Mesorhizobium sp. B1-1-8]|uniref:alpha/beta fold hydrolase n=1 Tax=Mesorhizobium sp. B1-1-8 TaxID=2589976 RepID=UPI0015E376D8|nr:alpha/beta hydrolase [Mesorhizobium sp. B1-1-8]UCI07188.1 alpha/beta hydrolase [Mesorhizobium sp. B1-1-8]
MTTHTSDAIAARPDEATMQTIRVDGRQIAFACSGRGSPTVVLETGLGAESEEWTSVQNAVASFARIFRYDRAGRGASDRAPTPRDAYVIVDELRGLLRKADVPAPYVLVGQSLGGLLMRVFAQRYPADVVGLVLVDSMHEDQFDVFGPVFPPPTPSDPPLLEGIRQFWTSGWKKPESTVERIDFVEAIRQGREVGSLGDLPLHVITAGTFLHMPFIPPDRRETLQGLWEGLQERLLRLSSRSIQTFVRTSGHFVQRDDPRAVVESIRRMMG